MKFTREELDSLLTEIEPVDEAMMDQAQQRLDNLTKPLGSLGQLESLARRVCGIRRSLTPTVARKVILTFAADHGVAEEGVSTVPQEVTGQMITNFLNGGAGVNVLARHVGAEVRVVDVGVLTEVVAHGLISARVRAGTANLAKGPAMSIDEALAAMGAGIAAARQAIADGADIIGTGEMGIANTTPSSALYAALLDMEVEDITGRGTGIDDEVLLNKIEVIRRALAVNRKRINGPLDTLAAVGGLEIAAICGLVLEAARSRVPVVVDGFISSAGAMVAMKMKREALDYCFFSHMSAEKGHRLFFERVGLTPILDLGLRLGEGTGAALAINIVEAGVKIITEMATFSEAGVSPGSEISQEQVQ